MLYNGLVNYATVFINFNNDEKIIIYDIGLNIVYSLRLSYIGFK